MGIKNDPIVCIRCHNTILDYREIQSLCIDCFVSKNQNSILNEYFVEKYQLQNEKI